MEIGEDKHSVGCFDKDTLSQTFAVQGKFCFSGTRHIHIISNKIFTIYICRNFIYILFIKLYII